MDRNGIYFEGLVRPRRLRARRELSKPVSSLIPATSGADDFFSTLCELVPVALESYRLSALRRRVPACLRMLGVQSPQEACLRLAERPELAGRLLDVVLLGVTEFFRDPEVFEFLGRTVLVEWAEKPRPRRIWSAACSSGQELYSLAMCVHARGLLRETELVGSDCRAAAVEAARTGVYPVIELETVPRRWCAEYFEVDGSFAEIARVLRNRARWEISDLLCETLPGPWDMVLYRNMSIYLDAATADQVWRRVIAELAPGGILITGRADHPPEELPLRRLVSCVYQKEEIHD